MDRRWGVPAIGWQVERLFTTHTGHRTSRIDSPEGVIGWCIFGLGTSAASRCMNSSGEMTRCVVPSRQGVLSLSTTCSTTLVCTRSLAGPAG